MEAINAVTGVISGLASNQGNRQTNYDANGSVGEKGARDAMANNNFYANIGVNVGFSKSKSSTNSHIENAVVTTMKPLNENSSITYNNVKNITYQGTQAQGGTFIYNNVENIQKEAVELNNSYSSSSSNKGISAGATIGYGNKIQTTGNGVSISANRSNQNTVETIHANGNFNNVNEVHNNTKNMTLRGFNQEGGKVTGTIENLEVTSLQNTSTTTGSSKGMSVGISASGIPNSIGLNYSNTNGERGFVDNQSTFIVGEGSNLAVGKAVNTGAVIGKQGENSTLKIDEYMGQDLNNYDTMRTTGVSVGLQTGNIPISNIGYNQDSRDKEGISRNTVVGNVEIGTSTGATINTDLSKANEVTRDVSKTTNINVESQTIEYAVNPDKLKEDIGKAQEEISDVTRAFKESVNDRGDDNRNFFGQLREMRLNETIYNIAGERLDRANTQKDIKDTLEAAYKDLGYDVEIRFSTPSETPELDGKGGTAYVGDDGKHTVIINSGYLNGKTKGEILGVISEEASHVINGAEGRQIATGTDEKGLESTGRATNEYFKDKYKDDDTTISLTSEGAIDTSKLGTNVGDKRYTSVIGLKRDRYKNYKGEALDKKIIADYNLDAAKYYKLKAELKEGGNPNMLDYGLIFGGLIKKINPYISSIGYIDIIQKELRGVGTDERAAYLVALVYEEARNEKARQITSRELELMINIAQSGAETKKEKDMIRDLFLRDDNYNFDKLPNGVSIDEYWKRGIALYNDSRHRISIEELKIMKDRRYRYIINGLDTDVYLKPFTLERK